MDDIDKTHMDDKVLLRLGGNLYDWNWGYLPIEVILHYDWAWQPKLFGPWNPIRCDEVDRFLRIKGDKKNIKRSANHLKMQGCDLLRGVCVGGYYKLNLNHHIWVF